MDDTETDAEDVVEEVLTVPDDASDTESTNRSEPTDRKVPVDPGSVDLQPSEFHAQDWLLITEAVYKTTSSSHSYTNFFEDRVDYARGLVPVVAAASEIPAGNIYECIDPRWGNIEPSSVDPSRETSHNASIHIDPTDADRDVGSFTDLDWLLVAEALSAWDADLHLGGPCGPQRADERVETLKNAAVRAAGYTDVTDILPVVRTLFEEYQHST